MNDRAVFRCLEIHLFYAQRLRLPWLFEVEDQHPVTPRVRILRLDNDALPLVEVRTILQAAKLCTIAGPEI